MLGENVGDGVGFAVSHVLSSSLQMPLSQSVPLPHFFPARHGGHSRPPQSTDVSSPFLMSSMHVNGVGLAVGDKVGDEVGDEDGDNVGKPLGAAVVGAAVGASVLSQQSR